MRYSCSSIVALATVLALGTSVPLAAQAVSTSAQQPTDPQTNVDPAEPAPTVSEDTIVVFGRRLLGQVDAPQAPLLELGTEDIAAYGAGSIEELLQQLTPQITSARGRGGGGGPVILVNGVRISSFRELRSYPPEAIEKVEVFPEEVAQRYGYSADQRVVNFILKDNYSSRELEVEYGQPWDGGYSTQEVEGTYLMISGPSRLNFNLEWNNSSSLTEADRGVIQANPPTVATDPDPARYRSLVSDTASLEATANWTTRLGEAGNALSLNGTYERSDTLRLQGLDAVVLVDPAGNREQRTLNAASPLMVDSRTQTYSLGSTLNLGLGDWQVTGTADGSLIDATSRIGRRLDLSALQAAASTGALPLAADLGTFPDAGFDQADTRTVSASGLVTARTQPFYVPAGDVSLTLDTGLDYDHIRSDDTRGAGGPTRLGRSNLNAGFNLGVPLTSRADDFLGAAGDISLNLSAGLDRLSDFGTLYEWSVGLTWGLTDTLTTTATYINRDSAPSLGQLGNPQISTPNVQVFDFATNTTALVTVVSGGNPSLPGQSQSDWKLGLVWELPVLDRANFSVDYIRNHSDDVASSFPLLTPDVETAFPGRVTRDAAGALVQIDQRPVSFAQQDVERLQFGLNLSGQIGSGEEGGGPGSGLGGGPAGGFGGRRGGAGGPGGSGGGRAPGAGNGEQDGAGRSGAGQGRSAGGMGADAPYGQAGQQAGGQARQGFDRARFRSLRTLLCGDNGADVALRLARGEDVIGADGEKVTLPPQFLERLRAGGELDPAKVERLRQGICSMPTMGAQGEERSRPGEGGQGESQQSEAPAAGPGAGSPPNGSQGSRNSAGRGGGPGGGNIPGFGGGAGGRWFLNLQYTLDLQNEVLVAPGGPLLDLLDGDALSGGGQPRHSATARGGAFYSGFGTFLSATYTGASRINGNGRTGSTDLAFDDLFTIDWRVFVDLGRQQRVIDAVPLLDRTRLSFRLDNIFDARQRVTDTAGITPVRYQPFIVDPTGRRFEIELRKLF